MYYVYALVNNSYNRIYVGITNKPNQRLNAHNSKHVKSTKAYAPWKRFYLKAVPSRLEARELEKKLKSGQGKEYLRSVMIKKFNLENDSEIPR